MNLRTGWKLLCVGLVLTVASAGYGQYTRFVTGFEEPGQAGEEFSGGFLSTEEAIWQQPSWSGSTMGVGISDSECQAEDCSVDQWGNPWENSAVVQEYDPGTHWGPSAFTGVQSYLIYWPWTTPANTSGLDGVRATTLSVDNLERPSIHLGGKVTFKMVVLTYQYDAASNDIGALVQPGGYIRLAMGVTETGNDLAMGSYDPGSTGAGIEWVYPTDINTAGPDDHVPAANSSGLIAWPPHGERYEGTAMWPPCNGLETDNLNACFGQPNDWYTVEFDLSDPNLIVRGFAGGSADGILDATSNGDGVNRGYIENLTFTNDPGDTTGKIVFVYIDDLQFESPVADPVDPPTVLQPLAEGDTEVRVQCVDGASEAELFINDGSIGTAVPNPVDDIATFNSPPFSLAVDDVVKAKQTKDGRTSDFSLPVLIFAAGTVLADNFDGYDTQADLNVWWLDSIANPDPSTAKLRLSTGSAASCPNVIYEENPAGSDAARLYRSIGGVNGSDTDPLIVTWYFQHRGESGGAGERAKLELARMQGGVWSTASSARLPGTTGIVLDNGPAAVAEEVLEQYSILLLQDSATNGFMTGNQGLVAPTGVAREPDAWHKMQIEVKTDVINYYIDNVLANPVTTNGDVTTSGLPIWPDGVPRPSPEEGYDFIIIGQGFSNNGPAMLFDNVSVTIGGTALPFGDPNPVGAPDVAPPLIPGGTLVTVENVNSNATAVTVYVNDVNPVTTNGVGAFLDNTATVVVPALLDGDAVTATQTVDVAATPTESCQSFPVVVAVPQVTVESILVPGQTLVSVSNLEEADASTVTVYRSLGPDTKVFLGSASSPLTEPQIVDITPNALADGETIVATQTVAGIEGPESAGVVVAVPAPTTQGGLNINDTVVTVLSVNTLATDVTVYVNDVPTNVTTTGVTELDVTVASLFVNDSVYSTQTIAGIESPPSNTVLVSFPICKLVLDEDFNTDTSASWNINATADTAYEFAFDYSSVGVPASPNGDGSRLGLRLAANIVLPGSIEAITVSPQTVGSLLAADGYRIEFDMWINTIYPETSSGSTEFISAGVGYDNATVNQAAGGGLQNATTGDGAWFAISNDADALQDIRAYLDVSVQDPSTGQFMAGTDATANNTNFNQFYIDLFGIPPVPPEQIALFPSQGGRPMMAGAPGMAWHRIAVTAVGDRARWEVNDVIIADLDANNGPISLDGNVSFGFMDIFTSVSSRPDLSFGLIDNLRVLVGHTPGANGDWDADTDVDLDDYAAFADCYEGPGATADPLTGPSCVDLCLAAFDLEPLGGDGDIDLEDFAAFQASYAP